MFRKMFLTVLAVAFPFVLKAQDSLTIRTEVESNRIEMNGATSSQGFAAHAIGEALKKFAPAMFLYGRADISPTLEGSTNRFERCVRYYLYPDCGKPALDPSMQYRFNGGMQLKIQNDDPMSATAIKEVNAKAGVVWWNQQHQLPQRVRLGGTPQRLLGGEAELNAVFGPGALPIKVWSIAPFIKGTWLTNLDDPNDGDWLLSEYPLTTKDRAPLRLRTWNSQSALYLQGGVRGRTDLPLDDSRQRGLRLQGEFHVLYDNGSFGYDKGLLSHTEGQISYYVQQGKHVEWELGITSVYTETVTGRDYDYNGYYPFFDYADGPAPVLWRPRPQASTKFFLTYRIR